MTRYIKMAMGKRIVGVSTSDLRALQSKVLGHAMSGLTELDVALLDACISHVIRMGNEGGDEGRKR